MFKKIISLSIIALMLFSCLGNINAAKISVDGGSRVVSKFRIIDMGTTDNPQSSVIWSRDVAGADEHSKVINSEPYFLHTLNIIIAYEGNKLVKIPQMVLTVACYDGGDITLFAHYSGLLPYKNWVAYTINGEEGIIQEPGKII